MSAKAIIASGALFVWYFSQKQVSFTMFKIALHKSVVVTAVGVVTSVGDIVGGGDFFFSFGSGFKNASPASFVVCL